jgi:hypothetical protein
MQEDGEGDIPFSIKVGEEIDQVEILKKERTVEASSLDLVRVRSGYTVRSCVGTAKSVAIGRKVGKIEKDIHILRLCVPVIFVAPDGRNGRFAVCDCVSIY